MCHSVASPDDGMQDPVIAWLNAVVPQVLPYEINMFLGAFDGDQPDSQSAAAAKHCAKHNPWTPAGTEFNHGQQAAGDLDALQEIFELRHVVQAQHRNPVQSPDLPAKTRHRHGHEGAACPHAEHVAEEARFADSA
jgi:hypothetical protein